MDQMHDEEHCMLQANLGPYEYTAVCTCLVENDHILDSDEAYEKWAKKEEARRQSET